MRRPYKTVTANIFDISDARYNFRESIAGLVAIINAVGATGIRTEVNNHRRHLFDNRADLNGHLATQDVITNDEANLIQAAAAYQYLTSSPHLAPAPPLVIQRSALLVAQSEINSLSDLTFLNELVSTRNNAPNTFRSALVKNKKFDLFTKVPTWNTENADVLTEANITILKSLAARRIIELKMQDIETNKEAFKLLLHADNDNFRALINTHNVLFDNLGSTPSWGGPPSLLRDEDIAQLRKEIAYNLISSQIRNSSYTELKDLDKLLAADSPENFRIALNAQTNDTIPEFLQRFSELNTAHNWAINNDVILDPDNIAKLRHEAAKRSVVLYLQNLKINLRNNEKNHLKQLVNATSPRDFREKLALQHLPFNTNPALWNVDDGVVIAEKDYPELRNTALRYWIMSSIQNHSVTLGDAASQRFEKDLINLLHENEEAFRLRLDRKAAFGEVEFTTPGRWYGTTVNNNLLSPADIQAIKNSAAKRLIKERLTAATADQESIVLAVNRARDITELRKIIKDAKGDFFRLGDALKDHVGDDSIIHGNDFEELKNYAHVRIQHSPQHHRQMVVDAILKMPGQHKAILQDIFSATAPVFAPPLNPPLAANNASRIRAQLLKHNIGGLNKVLEGHHNDEDIITNEDAEKIRQAAAFQFIKLHGNTTVMVMHRAAQQAIQHAIKNNATIDDLKALKDAGTEQAFRQAIAHTSRGDRFANFNLVFRWAHDNQNVLLNADVPALRQQASCRLAELHIEAKEIKTTDLDALISSATPQELRTALVAPPADRVARLGDLHLTPNWNPANDNVITNDGATLLRQTAARRRIEVALSLDTAPSTTELVALLSSASGGLNIDQAFRNCLANSPNLKKLLFVAANPPLWDVTNEAILSTKDIASLRNTIAKHIIQNAVNHLDVSNTAVKALYEKLHAAKTPKEFREIIQADTSNTLQLGSVLSATGCNNNIIIHQKDVKELQNSIANKLGVPLDLAPASDSTSKSTPSPAKTNEKWHALETPSTGNNCLLHSKNYWFIVNFCTTKDAVFQEQLFNKFKPLLDRLIAIHPLTPAKSVNGPKDFPALIDYFTKQRTLNAHLEAMGKLDREFLVDLLPQVDKFPQAKTVREKLKAPMVNYFEAKLLSLPITDNIFKIPGSAKDATFVETFFTTQLEPNASIRQAVKNYNDATADKKQSSRDALHKTLETSLGTWWDTAGGGGFAQYCQAMKGELLNSSLGEEHLHIISEAYGAKSGLNFKCYQAEAFLEVINDKKESNGSPSPYVTFTRLNPNHFESMVTDEQFNAFNALGKNKLTSKQLITLNSAHASSSRDEFKTLNLKELTKAVETSKPELTIANEKYTFKESKEDTSTKTTTATFENPDKKKTISLVTQVSKDGVLNIKLRGTEALEKASIQEQYRAIAVSFYLAFQTAGKPFKIVLSDVHPKPTNSTEIDALYNAFFTPFGDNDARGFTTVGYDDGTGPRYRYKEEKGAVAKTQAEHDKKVADEAIKKHEESKKEDKDKESGPCSTFFKPFTNAASTVTSTLSSMASSVPIVGGYFGKKH